MIFLTSIDRIFVPRDKAEELVRRLGGTATATAILDADDRGVRLTAEQKQVVLDTLEQWSSHAGVSGIGAELGTLRYELMRDLRQRPSDR